MNLYPVKYKENAWHTIIDWLKPRNIANFLIKPNDEEASLYMIINKNMEKILYLGMTHRQYAMDRITEHGYKEGFISIGIMKPVNYERVTKRRVEEAESLLINIYKPRDNTTKKKEIVIKEPTLIENKGFCPFFPRYLYYGMCTSKEIIHPF